MKLNKEIKTKKSHAQSKVNLALGKDVGQDDKNTNNK